MTERVWLDSVMRSRRSPGFLYVAASSVTCAFG